MTGSTIDRRGILRGSALGAGAVAASGLLAAPAMAQTAPAASTWQQIKDRGELRIGAAPSEPWFAKDQRSGEWSGIGWAMGVAIAKELNVKPVAVETSWGNAVAGLQANQFDVMFVMDATPQRALAVDFPAQPFFYYAQGVLVRDGLAVKRWEELDKPEIKVGVTLGTSPDRDVTMRLTKATIERFPSNDETTAAFQAGRVDAMSFFHPALVMQQRRVRKGTVLLPEPFRYSTTSAGVRREADKTWRDWLGLTLDYYYVTGQTQKIYEDFLVSRQIDPKTAPAIMRELWGKS
ncbi:polar amino acid transport system substrate-binding protein [Stella humosa]|uniref:Polar amino acid transport system substrate-binding protein n=1 Tax=Stella humosa TaxID=94 RepID=A0A3N1MC15_9PROT|nr:transporter substrate-binding domain-containing protein [Stella humosa]ROQ01281.1 polar amino acid transport system substrate-binding protein [Stella humosa]BBK31655.1 ABC transporter substrate-binding protein [Stella humosa]